MRKKNGNIPLNIKKHTRMPAMTTGSDGSCSAETQVWSLGPENPLQEGMATHSSILAWRIPQTEEPGGLQSMGLQRVGHNWVTNYYSSSNTITRSLPMQASQKTR